MFKLQKLNVVRIVDSENKKTKLESKGFKEVMQPLEINNTKNGKGAVK